MEENKKNPKVSVIVPTYNRGDVLPRTIKSVLNQSFKDFELLIVDDGSTDNTKEVVDKFKEQDDRVGYFRYTPNKGGNVARNLGIKKSRGRYIAFLDSDDEFLPDSLKKRLEVIEELSKNFGLVYCQATKKILNSEYSTPERGIEKEESVLRYLFQEDGSIQTSMLMLKREVLEQNNIWFDEDLKRHQDWDFVLRLKKCINFYFVKEPLVIWHAEDAYSKLTQKFNPESSLRFIDKYREEFNKHPKALANFQWNLATKCLRAGQIKEGRKFLKESNKKDHKIKKSFLYFYSFLGKGAIKILSHFYYQF